MLEDNIAWSPRRWALRDLPKSQRVELQKLKRNRSMVAARINGDELYVRRVDNQRYQYGLSLPVFTSLKSEQN
jgi:hypothetical protein